MRVPVSLHVHRRPEEQNQSHQRVLISFLTLTGHYFMRHFHSFTPSIHSTKFNFYSGGGKKSHEKLLIVTYAMRAMGLHRLAETAAALLKRNTGIVVNFGDSSDGEVTSGVDANESKEIKTEEQGESHDSENNSASNECVIIKSEQKEIGSDDVDENDVTTANTFVNPVPEPLHITKAKARAAKLKADKAAKSEKANKKKTDLLESVIKSEPFEREPVERSLLIVATGGNDDNNYF